jgi:hypothetical protein
VQPLPDLPGGFRSTRVLVRFASRLLILICFASFGGVGFGRSAVALLWMSILFCVVIAGLRREQFLADDLNHWDETAAYGALCALAHGLVQ